MVRRNPVRLALLVVAVVLGNLALGSLAFAESFDEPLRKSVVDLGRSPYLLPTSPSQIELFCYYYPAFMIKQLNDPGLKGTRWVTIVPILNGHVPACSRSHGSAERFIEKEWWTFIGVKGSLLFLEAADGEDGGMPFRILDLKTGKKIFEDSVWGDGHFEFADTFDGEMSLRYLRTVREDCSITWGGTSCWNKFREKWGLPPATAPKCTNFEGKPVPVEEKETPTAVVYPVAVELFPRSSIKAVPGPVKCMEID